LENVFQDEDEVIRPASLDTARHVGEKLEQEKLVDQKK
jgi:hypothetical protein